MAIISSSTAYADFTVNVDQKTVYKHFGVYVLDDLGVGESAYVRQSLFCIDESGVIKIPKDLKVVTDRAEYGSYFKVKRQPNDKISVELIPAKSDSKRKEIVDFLQDLVSKQQALPCSALYSLFGYSKPEMLSISTVEGAGSLREMLDNTKP
jgi:hypothetical protein